MLASRLINAVGWQSLFYIGGILPLGLSIVLIRVGWAMGLGRLGSFVGPLAIGLLVNRGWQIGDCFAALGTAALCAALFTSLIGIKRSCGATKANRVTAATGEEL